MKTILRKTTALFMAFLICLTGMPFTALADVTDSSNSFSLANVSALTALELAPRSAVIPVGNSQTFVASLVTGGSAQVIDGGECKWSSDRPERWHGADHMYIFQRQRHVHNAWNGDGDKRELPPDI